MTLKKPILTALLLFAATGIFAQKLPNKQTASVWAPTNITVDGKADEWNNTYQARNTATDMAYTLSNDDKNLYLTTYITTADVLFYKVLTGGITFIIKNNDHDLSFRYPAFAVPASFSRLPRGEVLTGKDDDPLIVKNNTVITTKAKEVEVTGVSGIDNLISIYNEHGIKAVGRFDAKLGYVYELAIPLKYLNFISDTKPKISYQIMVNGGKSKFVRNVPVVISGEDANGAPTSSAQIDAGNQRLQIMYAERYASTEFSGEYIIAKKP